MKEIAGDSSKFDQNGRKLSKWIENTDKKEKREKEKLLVMSNFSFAHNVFNRLFTAGT